MPARAEGAALRRPRPGTHTRRLAAVGLTLAAGALLVLLAAGTPAGAGMRRGEPAQARARSAAAAHGFVYPLRVSADRRYLVDQRNVPFLVVGDSPQSLIGNLSVREAAAYIANRKAAGFNSLLVDLLCARYTGCRADGATYDGIGPFTTPGDLSTPNPAYFARADAIIRLAAKAGMVVFLDPIETGGWLGVLRDNGVARDYAFGRFLGERYGRFRNIVWCSGNDFQTWRSPADDAVVLAVAKGIRSVDRTHLQTVELDYYESASLDDSRWRPVVEVDAAYTYRPTYAEVLKEYGRKHFMPVVMIEAGYEFEQNSPSISYGDPRILRRQEYWSMLSGATGQFYGNRYTWQFARGWKKHLDTPGSAQFGYLKKLFAGRRWFRLVPDRRHTLVTRGYGTFRSAGDVGSGDYVTTASTPDGRLAISYLPTGGTIVVDMARFAGPVRARWYDPTTGTYSPVSGSPFRNSGRVAFTTVGRNAAGDRDWVLTLTTR